MNAMIKCHFTEQIPKSEAKTSSFLLRSMAHSFPEGFKYLNQPKRDLNLSK